MLFRSKTAHEYQPAVPVHGKIDSKGVNQIMLTFIGRQSSHKENKEWAKNTIVHIAYNKSSYILNCKSIIGTFLLLTAFMLNNNIAGCGKLVFFIDGARDLQNAIPDRYGWRSYEIILDWFHLEKKGEIREELDVDIDVLDFFGGSKLLTESSPKTLIKQIKNLS